MLSGYSTLKDVPIIGTGLLFLGKSEKEATRDTDRLILDPYSVQMPVRFWIGPELFVAISDPKELEIVLNTGACLDRPDQYKVIGCAKSLFELKGAAWKRDRRALNPTLNSPVTNRFLPVFNAKAMHLCDQLTRTPNTEDDFKHMLITCLINLLIATLFDMDYELSLTEGTDIYKKIDRTEYFLRRRMNRFWLQSDFIYSFTKEYEEQSRMLATINDLLHGLVQRKNERVTAKSLATGVDYLQQQKEKNGLTFVQKLMMLKRDGFVDNDVIHDHLLTIFFAGSLTTPSAVITTLIMLAMHPEYQDKVVAELRDVFESVDAPVTRDSLAQLTFVEMVLKESMRLFPPAPVFSRKCAANVQTPTGCIPTGATVMLSVPKIHRDRRQWGDNANDFYPERFFIDNMHDTHAYSFMSFSRGPRNCIGAQYAMTTMKIVLVHLLRRFQFHTKYAMDELRFQTNITAFVSNERPLQLTPREF